MTRMETSRRRLVGIRGVMGAWALGLAMVAALMGVLGADPTSASGAASVIAVTTPLDELDNNEMCSLREAIQAANLNQIVGACPAGSVTETDTILLEAKTYTLSIAGTTEDNNNLTGDLDILEGLSILGAGPGQTIIDADGIDRIFDVASTARTVTISSVTLQNGSTSQRGGCLEIEGSDVTLVDVVVQDCSADLHGGGLSSADFASVVVSQTEIILCSSGRGGGGAYVNSGSLTLEDSAVLSNTASGWGGGVYLEGTTSVTVNSTDIVSNTGEDGGGFSVYRGSLRLNGGQTRGNSANDGGGIHVRDGGSVALAGGNVVGNTAAGETARGGGLYIESGTAVLSAGQIEGNRADTGAGVYLSKASAIFTQTGTSTVTHNTADTSGGGLYVNNGIAYLEGGMVYGNTAESTADEEGGGGVMVHYGLVEATGGQILENAAYRGGGVYVMDAGAVFTQTAGLVGSNVATAEGGGFYVWQGTVDLFGGAVGYNTADLGAGVYIHQGGAVVAGGEVLSNTAAVAGGGVLVYTTSGWLEMRSGQIAGNTAETGAGVAIEYGSATLTGGEISRNSADWGAGVAVISSTAVLTQTGGAIAFNDAVEGGGVYVDHGQAALTGAIVGNEAGYGGGIYSAQGTATMVNSTISSNTAQHQGGGLYNEDGTMAVIYGTIADNVATQGWGIAYGSKSPTVTNTILDNGAASCSNQSLASNGYNLEDGDSCSLSAIGDITNTNPMLEVLMAEGGTWVHPLKEGSPAIDRGLCLVEIGLDQLGVPRPRGDGCDIGAYEFPLWELYLPLVLR